MPDNDNLQSLHELLALDLLDRLKNGEKVVAGGEAVVVKASASTLNVIRQFLKDNGIEAVRTPKNPLGRLAANLPSFNDEEDGERLDA